jgi:hypothetical protein
MSDAENPTSLTITADTPALRALTGFLKAEGITPVLCSERSYGPASKRADRWQRMTQVERAEHLETTFGRFPIRLPHGYRFNRDEHYDR